MENDNKNPLNIDIENEFPKMKINKLYYVIQKCIDCKLLSYKRFLLSKLELKNINHRKIV